jgi:hypothetical protein
MVPNILKEYLATIFRSSRSTRNDIFTDLPSKHWQPLAQQCSATFQNTGILDYTTANTLKLHDTYLPSDIGHIVVRHPLISFIGIWTNPAFWVSYWCISA